MSAARKGLTEKDLDFIIPFCLKKLCGKKNKGGTVNCSLCSHYTDMLLQTSSNQMECIYGTACRNLKEGGEWITVPLWYTARTID